MAGWRKRTTAQGESVYGILFAVDGEAPIIANYFSMPSKRLENKMYFRFLSVGVGLQTIVQQWSRPDSAGPEMLDGSMNLLTIRESKWRSMIPLLVRDGTITQEVVTGLDTTTVVTVPLPGSLWQGSRTPLVLTTADIAGLFVPTQRIHRWSGKYSIVPGVDELSELAIVRSILSLRSNQANMGASAAASRLFNTAARRQDAVLLSHNELERFRTVWTLDDTRASKLHILRLPLTFSDGDWATPEDLQAAKVVRLPHTFVAWMAKTWSAWSELLGAVRSSLGT